MDLGFLAPAFAASGPYATAYLDTTSAVEGAALKIAARWRARREELAAAGADEATLDAMAAVAGQDHGNGETQVLVGSHGRLLLDVRLPAPPRRETATFGPLPDVLQVIGQFADVVPYVLVVADRAGADITAYGDHGDAAAERHVRGGTFDIRKVKPGDWAHKKFQQRAENLWQTNAEQVAQQVAGIASTVRARIIIAAGDVRALGTCATRCPSPRRVSCARSRAAGRPERRRLRWPTTSGGWLPRPPYETPWRCSRSSSRSAASTTGRSKAWPTRWRRCGARRCRRW